MLILSLARRGSLHRAARRPLAAAWFATSGALKRPLRPVVRVAPPAAAFCSKEAASAASEGGPPSEVDRVFNDGLQAYRQGDFEAAVASWQNVSGMLKEQLGDKHPKYAEHLGYVGLALRNQGDFAAALKSYNEGRAILNEVLSDSEKELHLGYATLLNNMVSDIALS